MNLAVAKIPKTDADKDKLGLLGDPKTAYIETATGGKFHFMEPTEDEISILDIAHALSNQCRYTGHCARFYSVAEHSLLVASLLPAELRLAGLMHDASEAYLTDVAAPVKPFLGNYKEIESNIMAAVAKKVGFTWPLVDEVKRADLTALLIEARQLMPSGGEDWREGCGVDRAKMPKVKLALLPPPAARIAFLSAFEHLTGTTVIPKLARPSTAESNIILSSNKRG